MKTWHNLLILISFMVVLLFLMACQKNRFESVENTPLTEETVSFSPTPETIILPTPQPLPDFLTIVFPEPSATYTLAEFEALTEKYGSMVASGEVFFDVHMEPLIEEGDFFDTVNEFFPRISVKIDGQLYTEPKDFIRTDESQQRYIDSETGEALYQLPAGRPFSLYYPMEDTPGLHTVEVEIRKTSGEVASYSWSFLLTE